MADSGDPAGSGHRAHGGARSHNRAQPPAAAGLVQPAAVHEVRPAQRVWLQEDGVRMFGPGTHELLGRVDQTGSLNRAAKDMGMAYSKAWRLVREVEQRLGVDLFERRTGGPGGGGSRLTDEGRLLLQRFEAFTRDADTALAALFEEHFGDLPYAAQQAAPDPEPRGAGDEPEPGSVGGAPR
jgi:molybdate transport system regulatory protein